LTDNIISTFEPPDSSFAADKYNYVITDMTGSSFLNHLEERMREWQSLYDMWIKKLRSSAKPCTDVSVISGLQMQDLELRKVSDKQTLLLVILACLQLNAGDIKIDESNQQFGVDRKSRLDIPSIQTTRPDRPPHALLEHTFPFSYQFLQ